MNNFNLPVTANPLKTRSDVQLAVKQLCQPLRRHYSKGSAQLHLDSTGVTYTERTALMEAFSRPLWGLVPLMAGGQDSDLLDIYVEGIKNGTNPAHKEYWGKLGDIDQLMVEMPPLALGLSLIPEKIWDPLTSREKQNFASWLNQINHKAFCGNNWLFFAVLVNMSLRKIGAPYNAEVMERCLKKIEGCYISDGWYADGPKTRQQRDYYIPFGIFYYGLIYSAIMKEQDPVNSEAFQQRAKRFAQDFVHWFAADGSAFAFGRSMTYRFAQGAFWGALAFAGVEALPWGVIKGLYLRHLRWWLSKPIYSREGVLTIGYGYPNLNMSEEYNAPGSPYWAMKAFLPLSLSQDHPFWQAQELPLPCLSSVSVQKNPGMVICRNKTQSHVFALSGGQWVEKFDPVHHAAKYSKFAYSSVFGFSVPRDGVGLAHGAYDSMLALAEEGEDLYRVRGECETVKMLGPILYSKWKPWKDVEIKTWLIPALPWHVRVHKIRANRNLDSAESGFAISREDGLNVGSDDCLVCKDNAALAKYPWGLSGIVDLQDSRKPQVTVAMPNTNLVHSRTVIPTLTGLLKAGKHLLISAVFADPSSSEVEQWFARPRATVKGSRVRIEYGPNYEMFFDVDTRD